MGRYCYLWVGLLAVLLWSTAASAETIQINPTKDNTLYEDEEGDFSNGAGDYIFAGQTAVLGTRRALLHFDIAGNIPAGAEIQSVSLELTVSAVPPSPMPLSIGVHVLNADWGEGASDASDPGGAGVPPLPDDATWIHRFFDTVFWTTPGGDFQASPSGTTVAGTGQGPITFSSAGMADDVQDWLDTPATNFGWLVVADESTEMTARRFNSREHPIASSRPVLTIDYDTGEPVVPAVSEWGVAILLLGALTIGSIVFRRPIAQV